MDVIKMADHLVDLGPDGGAGGGRIVATGTPEALAAAGTATSGYLAEELHRCRALRAEADDELDLDALGGDGASEPVEGNTSTADPEEAIAE